MLKSNIIITEMWTVKTAYAGMPLGELEPVGLGLTFVVVFS